MDDNTQGMNDKRNSSAEYDSVIEDEATPKYYWKGPSNTRSQSYRLLAILSSLIY
jgi:hypothetical protein